MNHPHSSHYPSAMMRRTSRKLYMKMLQIHSHINDIRRKLEKAKPSRLFLHPEERPAAKANLHINFPIPGTEAQGHSLHIIPLDYSSKFTILLS